MLLASTAGPRPATTTLGREPRLRADLALHRRARSTRSAVSDLDSGAIHTTLITRIAAFRLNGPKPPDSRSPNPHSARTHLATLSPAPSFPGGFRTPALLRVGSPSVTGRNPKPVTPAAYRIWSRVAPHKVAQTQKPTSGDTRSAARSMAPDDAAEATGQPSWPRTEMPQSRVWTAAISQLRNILKAGSSWRVVL